MARNLSSRDDNRTVLKRPRVAGGNRRKTTETDSFKKRQGRTLGRRPGDNDTQDDILDAAEEAFAADGYAGTTLRDIAKRADDVNPAMVQYYFGSKEGLFKAIFVRRGKELGKERLDLLNALENRESPPTVEELVRAFLLPAFNLKRRGASGVAFMRLQARLQNEPAEITAKLRGSVYDELMQRYVVALQRVLPASSVEVIFWRMTFMVGAYFYTIADSNRLKMLSEGRCDPRDLDEAYRQLVSFFVGGMQAPSLD